MTVIENELVEIITLEAIDPQKLMELMDIESPVPVQVKIIEDFFYSETFQELNQDQIVEDLVLTAFAKVVQDKVLVVVLLELKPLNRFTVVPVDLIVVSRVVWQIWPGTVEICTDLLAIPVAFSIDDWFVY